MKKLKRWFRDWFRGYTDDDMRSLMAKMEAEHASGSIIELTAAEYRALERNCIGF